MAFPGFSWCTKIHFYADDTPKLDWGPGPLDIAVCEFAGKLVPSLHYRGRCSHLRATNLRKLATVRLIQSFSVRTWKPLAYNAILNDKLSPFRTASANLDSAVYFVGWILLKCLWKCCNFKNILRKHGKCQEGIILEMLLHFPINKSY